MKAVLRMASKDYWRATIFNAAWSGMWFLLDMALVSS
jgi:hypothetical protein